MTQVWEENVTVGLGKTGETRSIDCSALSPAVLRHIFTYGLRQIINDSMASGEDANEKIGLADKRIDNLIAGTLRAQRTASDPITAEAIRLALIKVKQAIGKKGLTEKQVGAAKMRALATDLVEKDETYRVQAEANLAALGEVDDIEIDLDDLED